MRRAAVGTLLATLVAAGAALTAATPAAARTPAAAPARHVVIVGLSGLRWSDLSPAATPALWRLAAQGSVANLVDYAVLPLTCPADGWLTLNSGARAQADHTDAGCRTFPAVHPSNTGATVPALPALIGYNQRFHNDPDWGLLASAANRAAGCATAVGPGAALALASPSGAVASYLPSPAGLTAGVLSRCPLTVVDLGNLDSSERTVALAAADRELQHILAELPAATTLLYHRARLHHQAPAPPADPGRRHRIPGRPARVRLDPAARPGRAHRPDPNGSRLAGPACAARPGRRPAHPRRPRGLARYRPRPDRPGHRRTGLAVHAQRVLLGLRAGRRGRPGRHRPAVLGRRAAAPPPARPVVAGGRGVRRVGARRDVPGRPVPLAPANLPGGLPVRGGCRPGPSHRRGRAGRDQAAGHPGPVRNNLPVHRRGPGPGRDDRVPAAAGDAVRVVGDRGRPVLRHRQRGAGHLRRHRPVRRRLAGARISAPLPRHPARHCWQ